MWEILFIVLDIIFSIIAVYAGYLAFRKLFAKRIVMVDESNWKLSEMKGKWAKKI